MDKLKLWEIASVIGANEPDEDDEDAPFLNGNERPDPDGPSVFNVRRVLALEEGRTPPGFDDPMSAEERRKILTLIQGGRKGGR